jgi:hypothetical protein
MRVNNPVLVGVINSMNKQLRIIIVSQLLLLVYSVYAMEQKSTASDEVACEYIKQNMLFLFDKKFTVQVEDEQFKIRESALRNSPVLNDLIEDFNRNNHDAILLPSISKTTWRRVISHALQGKPFLLDDKDLIESANAAHYLELTPECNNLLSRAPSRIAYMIKWGIHHLKDKPVVFDQFKKLYPEVLKEIMGKLLLPFMIEQRMAANILYTHRVWNKDLSADVMYNEEGAYACSGSFNGKLSATTLQAIFSPDGKRLALVSDISGQIKLFNLASSLLDEKRRGTILVTQSKCPSSLKVFFSNDGTMLLAYDNSACIQHYQLDSDSNSIKNTKSYTHDSPISHVALSRDDKKLAISSAEDHSVAICDFSGDIKNIKVLKKLTVDTDKLLTVNGKTLIVCSDLGAITLCDVETGKLLKTMSGLQKPEQIQMSSDGKILVVVGVTVENLQEIKLFSLSFGNKYIRELPGIMYIASKKIRSIMFDDKDNLVIVVAKKEINTTQIDTEVWKIDASKYTVEQALLIQYAQKYLQNGKTISSSPETVQKMYNDIFTCEQKKELQNILKL